MPLTPGTRLGPYEVVSTLGAGGMGEVFRARDTRLQREVALKILPDLFADDPDRLARFQREAQVLASLNSQNIAAIYGFEESGAIRALVLELVEGPTLADRIAAGPLPVDEAVAVAKQIVDALEAAHSQGIIHRDLKPANIKVRPDGTVKVLDFGLAKALDPATASPVETLNSPTLTARSTQPGMILGTAAYMAPEQAKGKPLDKRADIWAFGCVLYEMLTGRRAFMGEDLSDTLAFVIMKDPDWEAVPPNLPAPLARLLRRCLEKDRRQRLADIADARFDLDEALRPQPTASIAATNVVPVPAWRRALPWIVAGVSATALVGVLVLWKSSPAEAPRKALRLSTALGGGVTIAIGGGRSAVAISPDGQTLIFIGRTASSAAASLWVRRLDQLSPVQLPGTEGADTPFVSPDGEWIAFFADRKLKKVPIGGGAVSTLAAAPFVRGADWLDRDTIVFAPDRATPLMRVSAAGGDVQPLTELGADEATHRTPQVLPGGRAVLYTAHSSTSGFDVANIMVKPLPDGAARLVLRGGYNARYLESGHLLYVREGTLHAVPFDPERLETTGPSVPVIEDVSASTLNAVANVDVARQGTLVYLPGGEPVATGSIFWLNADGTRSALRAAPSITINLQFSPDGRRVAFDNYDGRQWDVFIYDWAREMLTPLTGAGGNEQRPVWTPDGTRVAYGSSRAEGNRLIYNLHWRRVDGEGEAQRLTDSKSGQRPTSWHPSGRFLAFTELTPATSWDVLVLPIEGDETTGWKPGTVTVFVNERAAELEPVFSPDGNWIAYQSDVSGRDEVYVRPFPGPGPREQISSGGGTHPVWSRTGQELLYVGQRKVMVASYTVSKGVFHPNKPRPWSDGPFAPRSGPVGRAFDLHPDGKRMAFTAIDEQNAPKHDHAVLILNFFDELRRLAPPAKR